jgi:hypothetical protein
MARKLSRRQKAAIAMKAKGIYNYGNCTVILPKRERKLTSTEMREREGFGKRVYALGPVSTGYKLKVGFYHEPGPRTKAFSIPMTSADMKAASKKLPASSYIQRREKTLSKLKRKLAKAKPKEIPGIIRDITKVESSIRKEAKKQKDRGWRDTRKIPKENRQARGKLTPEERKFVEWYEKYRKGVRLLQARTHGTKYTDPLQHMRL